MVDPQQFLDFYLDSQFEDIAGWKPLPRARMIKQAGRTMNSKRTRSDAFSSMDRLGDNSGTRMRREFGPGPSSTPTGLTTGSGREIYASNEDIGAQVSTLKKNQRNQQQFDKENQIFRDSTNIVDGVPMEFTNKELENRFRGLEGKARSKPDLSTGIDRYQNFKKFTFGYGDAANKRGFNEIINADMSLEDRARMNTSTDKHVYLKPEERALLKEQMFNHWDAQADEMEMFNGRPTAARVLSIDRDGFFNITRKGDTGVHRHPGPISLGQSRFLDELGEHQYQLPPELRKRGPLGDFANEALYEWNTYRNAAAADRAGMAHDLIRTIDTPNHPGMSLGEMMFPAF